MIDDVLALLVLGVTTDMIQGSISLPALAASLASAALFIGLGLLIGVKMVSPLLAWLDSTSAREAVP